MRQQLNGLKTMPNQLKLSKLSPYFLALSLSVSPLIGQSQVIEAQPQTTTQMANDNRPDPTPKDKARARYIVNKNVREFYYEHPQRFKEMSAAIYDEGYAKFYADRQTSDVYKIFISPITYRGLPIGDAAVKLWDYTQDESDDYMRQKMRANPEKTDRIFRDIVDAIMNQTYGNEAARLYNLHNEYRGNNSVNKLPLSNEYDKLKTDFGGDVALLDHLQRQFELSDKKMMDFVNGKISKEDIPSLDNMTTEEYKTFIENNFIIKINNSRSSANNYNTAIKEHHQNVKQFSSYGFALSSTLALFDPKKAHVVAQTNNALTSVYKGMDALKIASEYNESFDFTAFGNVVSGFGALVNLMQGSNGQSPDEVQIEMLQAILKNQQEMMKEIRELRNDVWQIQYDLNRLLRITEFNQTEIIDELKYIEKRLEDIEREVFDTQDLIKVVSHNEEMIRVLKDKGALLGEFYNAAGNDIDEDLWSALQESYNGVSLDNLEDPGDTFSKIRSHLNSIATFATDILENDKINTAYLDKANIEDFNLNKLKDRLDSTNIYWDWGLLPSIGSWLNQYIENGSIGYSSHNSLRYNGKILEKLKGHIINPQVFAQSLSEYMDIVKYRWLDHNNEGNVQQDKNAIEFCEDLKQIEKTIDAMRQHIPLAFAVFEYELKKLEDAHFDYIYREAFDNNLIYHDHYIEKSPESVVDFQSSQRYGDGTRFEYNYTSAGNKRVIYREEAGWLKAYTKNDIFFKDDRINREQITEKLESLSDSKFMALAEWTGIGIRSLNAKNINAHPVRTFDLGEDNPKNRRLHHNYYHEVKESIELHHNLHGTHGMLKPYVHSYRSIIPQYDANNPQLVIHYPLANPDAIAQQQKNLTNLKQVVAHEIFTKVGNIGKYWSGNLNKNPEYYLGNLYRAHFVLKTLVEGAYGKDYSNKPKLGEISNKMLTIKKIFDFIERKWMDEQHSFDLRPEVFQMFYYQNKYSLDRYLDHIKTEKAKEFFKTAEAQTHLTLSSNLTHNTDPEFNLNNIEKRKKMIFDTRSAGNMPNIPARTVKIYKVDVPDAPKNGLAPLKKAYKMIEIASQRQDMINAKDCLPSAAPGNE
ncbi:hypothetical protein QQ020_23450 [Fulvivirgaceae bacterium BMA12]|uniref:Uncharacterized protein n=1 Tax=Agaribacillus aureus TaxID=3051825 RepID=A0ABT8LDL5_9BACT|nr:hypothetical protein [Fulvivirgaceae bacterium BMA12]